MKETTKNCIPFKEFYNSYTSEVLVKTLTKELGDQIQARANIKNMIIDFDEFFDDYMFRYKIMAEDNLRFYRFLRESVLDNIIKRFQKKSYRLVGNIYLLNADSDIVQTIQERHPVLPIPYLLLTDEKLKDKISNWK